MKTPLALLRGARLCAPAFLFCLFQLTGCVSYWKGQEMQTDLRALQAQVDQLLESQKNLREKHAEDVDAFGTRLSNAEKRLSDAINQLRTGSADSGLELESIRQELNVLKGKYAEMEVKNGGGFEAPNVEASGAATSESATVLPTDAADLYRYGYERKKANDCPEAVRAFSEYVSKFPKKDRADSSLYLMAECQYQAKDYNGSVRSLQTIMQKYSKGKKMDDALLLIFNNFDALGRCKDGQPFLQTLIDDYPRSNLVKTARDKLKRSQKQCK